MLRRTLPSHSVTRKRDGQKINGDNRNVEKEEQLTPFFVSAVINVNHLFWLNMAKVWIKPVYGKVSAVVFGLKKEAASKENTHYQQESHQTCVTTRNPKFACIFTNPKRPSMLITELAVKQPNPTIKHQPHLCSNLFSRESHASPLRQV